MNQKLSFLNSWINWEKSCAPWKGLTCKYGEASGEMDVGTRVCGCTRGYNGDGEIRRGPRHTPWVTDTYVKPKLKYNSPKTSNGALPLLPVKKKKKEKKSSSANWEKLKGQLCVLSILWKKWAHIPICKTLNHIMTEFNSKLERYMKLQFPESISPKE